MVIPSIVHPNLRTSVFQQKKNHQWKTSWHIFELLEYFFKEKAKIFPYFFQRQILTWYKKYTNFNRLSLYSEFTRLS